MSFEEALQGWSDFYIATAGAAAALLGLLFVGVSINIGRLDIAQRLDIRSRANQAFINLTFVLVLSLTALIPDQDARSIATTCGILTALGLFGVGHRLFVLARSSMWTGGRLRPLRHLVWTLLAMILLGVATYQLWVSESEGTLYSLIAVVFLLLLGAADVSWDLLIAVGEDEAEDSAVTQQPVAPPAGPLGRPD
jgi:modulator of FtsH protease